MVSKGSTISNTAFTRDGFLNLAHLPTLGPARLATFDLELLAACRDWLRRSLSMDEFVAEVDKFLVPFGIYIVTDAEYTAVSRKPETVMIGDRLAFAIAASVKREITSGVGRPRDQIYWRTLYDLVCYRGLEKNVTWP